MVKLSSNALEKGTGLSAPAESWDVRMVSYGAMNLHDVKDDVGLAHNSSSQIPELLRESIDQNQQMNIYCDDQTSSRKMLKSANPGSMHLLLASHDLPAAAANLHLIS